MVQERDINILIEKAVKPVAIQRMTANRKTEMVLDVLQGRNTLWLEGSKTKGFTVE